MGHAYHRASTSSSSDDDHENADFVHSLRPLNIALASDYFFPKFGGVESHIYSLAQALAKRNHRVRPLCSEFPRRPGN